MPRKSAVSTTDIPIVPSNRGENSNSTTEFPLWSALVSEAALWAAWQRVRTNAGCAGGDGTSVFQFERTAPARVAALRTALLSGRYRPGPMRSFLIPKPNGGERRLDIPTVADRIVQTAAAQAAGPVIDRRLEPESFAYRPGRGVAQAVAAVVRARRDGFRWTAEGDIQTFFEAIPHTLLLEKLLRAARDERFVDLVALWLECHAPSGIGIPQGSPISPLLANLHLDCVDEAVATRGIRLVRYADDFLLLAKTAGEAEAALERMAATLAEHGLRLNPEKTSLRAFDQSLRFLGHLFVRGMAWKEVAADEPPPLPDAPREEEIEAFRLTPPEPDELADAGDDRADGRIVYLLEPRARLIARNEGFAALVGEETVPRFLVHASRLERIEIGPGASAEWNALELAAAHDVPVFRVDGWGQTHGEWRGNRPPSARRTMAQAQFLADPARRDALATMLACGRVRNQWKTLRKLNLKRKDPEIATACVALAKIVDRLERPLPVATARGHEGNAGALYWPAYARVFEREWGFRGERERQPPGDPVNACLGYLAALLERDVRVAIGRAGLHPGLGALHAERDGGDALVYDLMEAFRALVPETILPLAVARGWLKPEMFAMRADGACRIEQVAKKALIRAHETRLNARVRSRRSGVSIRLRDLLLEEARALAALFLGEEPAFLPYERDH